MYYEWQGNLRGIDISLPKEFPHIYLDNQRGGHQMRFYIDPAQRLQLEGDFNNYFQIFAPKGYEVEALSIISPDIMQTIMRDAVNVDVEVYDSHIRIITSRHIYSSTVRQQIILAIAERILAEVDQRLQSWSEYDARHAHDVELRIFPWRGLRLGHYYVA